MGMVNLTLLAVRFFIALGGFGKWTAVWVRILLYGGALVFPFLRVGYSIFAERRVFTAHYGKGPRHSMDIYCPPGVVPDEPQPEDKAKLPIVIYVCGGGWLVGYKLWGAMSGLQLANHDVLFFAPDYRNFPDGDVDVMLNDLDDAFRWIYRNAHRFGGDPNNVIVAGQSAGAHLAVMAMLESVERDVMTKKTDVVSKAERKHAKSALQVEETGHGPKAPLEKHTELYSGHRNNRGPFWEGFKRPSRIVGISGVYDVSEFQSHMIGRGMPPTVMEGIMKGREPRILNRFSPTPFVRNLEAQALARLPPVVLFHGDADESVPTASAREFAGALVQSGIPERVHLIVLNRQSHTDPIIEEPMLGRDIVTPALYSLAYYHHLPSWCVGEGSPAGYHRLQRTTSSPSPKAEASGASSDAVTADDKVFSPHTLELKGELREVVLTPSIITQILKAGAWSHPAGPASGVRGGQGHGASGFTLCSRRSPIAPRLPAVMMEENSHGYPGPLPASLVHAQIANRFGIRLARVVCPF